MKKLELTFPSGTHLLVELPEGARTVTIYRQAPHHVTYRIGNDGRGFNLPFPGSYENIGKPSDLKEEDYAGIANDKCPVGSGKWMDYTINTPDCYECRCGKESFESAVEAAGWYLKNPHGEEAPDLSYFEKDWQAAQEKTFDLERTYLFKKIN